MGANTHSIEENENISFSESTEKVCSFQELNTLVQFVALVKDMLCHRHSLSFTLFLCVLYVFIFVFGVTGNILVIYVSTCKIRRRTASCMFILNLAVADLLVIIFCVPPTLLANVFSPWILGEKLCKAVTYSQGVFVLISVYSLVAISFDRFRAVYWPFGVTRSLSQDEALKVICGIWIIGLLIPIPWIFVFQLVQVTIGESGRFHIPFCHEAWSSKHQEIGYFLFVNMFLSYILPLTIISICNVHIWRTANPTVGQPNPLVARRIFYLKVFTILTFLFFLLWLPLYLIMTRVKISYTDSYHGGPTEKSVMYVIIPVSQLLGACNSCVNPILYAVLNQTFRKTVTDFLCIHHCFKKNTPRGILLESIRPCQTGIRVSGNVITEASV